jgi:general secretion pathway protein A
LSLLLVGGPGILSAVERRPAWEERVALKTLLGAFGPDETAAYVQHRLQTAGATRAIFDDSALETIHRLSHGVPRAINRLCDLALLIGYAEGLPTLTAEQIDSVCGELITVAAA